MAHETKKTDDELDKIVKKLGRLISGVTPKRKTPNYWKDAEKRAKKRSYRIRPLDEPRR